VLALRFRPIVINRVPGLVCPNRPDLWSTGYWCNTMLLCANHWCWECSSQPGCMAQHEERTFQEPRAGGARHSLQTSPTASRS